MSVEANLAEVRRRIEAAALRSGRDPAGVRLIGVTKGVPALRVCQAVAAGLADCGENVVQDAVERIDEMGEEAGKARWHFIGHLQTNKVNAALRLFTVIHSVDSVRLAESISRRAKEPVQVLLEVNVAGETSKFGFAPEEVAEAVKEVRSLPNLDLTGLMTVAPPVSDPEHVRPVFRQLRELGQVNDLPELSMGMTDDFEVAIEEGATMVRIGRAIFGERRQ